LPGAAPESMESAAAGRAHALSHSLGGADLANPAEEGGS
jgi:hypothetical protein